MTSRSSFYRVGLFKAWTFSLHTGDILLVHVWPRYLVECWSVSFPLRSIKQKDLWWIAKWKVTNWKLQNDFFTTQSQNAKFHVGRCLPIRQYFWTCLCFNNGLVHCSLHVPLKAMILESFPSLCRILNSFPPCASMSPKFRDNVESKSYRRPLQNSKVLACFQLLGRYSNVVCWEIVKMKKERVSLCGNKPWHYFGWKSLRRKLQATRASFMATKNRERTNGPWRRATISKGILKNVRKTSIHGKNVDAS